MEKEHTVEYYKELYKNHSEARKSWKLEIFEDDKGIHIYEKKKKKDIGWHLQHEIKNKNGITKMKEDYDCLYGGYRCELLETDLEGKTKRYLRFFTIFDYHEKGIEAFIGDPTNFKEYDEIRYTEDERWSIKRVIRSGIEEINVQNTKTERNYTTMKDSLNIGFDAVEFNAEEFYERPWNWGYKK